MNIYIRLPFYLTILSVFLLGSCELKSETIKPLFKCSEKLENPYGVCTHINKKGAKYEYERRDSDLFMIDSLGVKNIRCGFNWEYCQPNLSGKMSYKRFDAMMSSVPDSVDVLHILQPLTTKFCFSEWQGYIQGIVERYNKSGWWEIVNEVNLFRRKKTDFTIDDYFSMLKIAYMTIKRNNPKTTVLCGSVSGIRDRYLDSMLARGCHHYFDIVNIHRYANKGKEPEKFINDFRELSELLRHYGVKKPVWLTETGCSTATGYASEEIQAQRLPRIFLISFACGIDKVFWYKSRSNEISDDREKHFGLWHKDFTPKLSYYAYQTLIRMCPNKSSRPKLERKGDVYIASWERPNKQQVWGIWSTKGEYKIGLNISGGYSCYDYKGLAINKNGDSFQISPYITYIVGANNCSIKE